MKPAKVSVVGVGAIGALHVRCFREHPLAELVGVVDINPYRAQTVARARDVPWFTQVSDLLDSCYSDAAPVTVPEHHRSGIAMRLARAGKHLLLENPLAPSLAETDRLVADVEATGCDRW